MPALCVALTKAVGGGEERAHVARPTGGIAGGRAHVGDQQDVWQAGTNPGSGHGLRRGGAWDRTVGQEGKIEYGGAARAQEGYEGIQEGGPAPRGVLLRRQDGGMGCIQLDDEESASTRRPRLVGQKDAKDVKRSGGAVGAPEEETEAREGSEGVAREGGAGQRREGQGQTGHTVVCAAGTQRAEGEVAECNRAVVQCPCRYDPERQHPGRGRTGGPVLEMHQGSGAGHMPSPANDGIGVPKRDHAHYGRQGAVVGAGGAAAQGGAGR